MPIVCVQKRSWSPGRPADKEIPNYWGQGVRTVGKPGVGARNAWPGGRCGLVPGLTRTVPHNGIVSGRTAQQSLRTHSDVVGKTLGRRQLLMSAAVVGGEPGERAGGCAAPGGRAVRGTGHPLSVPPHRLHGATPRFSPEAPQTDTTAGALRGSREASRKSAHRTAEWADRHTVGFQPLWEDRQCSPATAQAFLSAAGATDAL